MTDISLPFTWVPLDWTGYGIANLALTLLALAWIVRLVVQDRWVAVRPAFLVAMLMHLLFQWPVWLFSGLLQRILQPYWSFALHLHVLVLLCLGWAQITRGWSARMRPVPDYREDPLFGKVATWFVVAIGALLTGLYLQRVSFACTGLSAAFIDPELSLLAREMSIKLAGGGWPVFAHSLFVSVVCPVAVFLALRNLTAAIPRRDVLAVAGNLVLVAASVTVVMLPWAKGNIMPTLVAGALGMCFQASGWMRRLAGVVLVFVVGMGTMVGIELLKERYPNTRGDYPFAQCVQRLQICGETRTLLNSLSSRTLALGMPSTTIQDLQMDLNLTCKAPMPPEVPIAVGDLQGEGPWVPKGAATVLLPPSAGKPAVMVNRGGQPPSMQTTPWPELARLYVTGIAYRAWVVPLQVGAWHYDYVRTHGSPGLKVLPLPRAWIGERMTDMPTRVHYEYAAGYYGGARVSTGTSPTSFLISYSAYMGFGGMLLALACVILFDIAAVWVLGQTYPPLKPLGIALVVVACMNLMLTDFWTTMASHGAVAALALLYGLTLTQRAVAFLRTRARPQSG